MLQASLMTTVLSTMAILSHGAVVPLTHHLSERTAENLSGLDTPDATFDPRMNKYYNGMPMSGNCFIVALYSDLPNRLVDYNRLKKHRA